MMRCRARYTLDRGLVGGQRAAVGVEVMDHRLFVVEEGAANARYRTHACPDPFRNFSSARTRSSKTMPASPL